jgi:hypothetical protein
MGEGMGLGFGFGIGIGIGIAGGKAEGQEKLPVVALRVRWTRVTV